MTYAVVWREDGRRRSAGRLELGTGSLVLEGSTPTEREARRVVQYGDLTRVRVERLTEPGRESRRSLVLDCRDGSRVEVTPVGGTGVLHELADLLGAARRAA